MSEKFEKLEGEVDRVCFKSEDTSFCVIDVKTEDDIVKAVGSLGNVEEGESVILTGEFVRHRTFGKQFKVAMFERSLPTNEASILRYLISGALETVKPVIAKRLVAEFGERTLDVIENEPEKLEDISGLNEEKAKAIHEDFKKTFAARSLLVYMSKNNVPTKYSIRAWRMYGNPAEGMIKTNPYLMCTDGIDLPFKKADEIAEREEIPFDSEQRIRAGIAFILRKYAQEKGHTCISSDLLKRETIRLLKIDADLYDRVKVISLNENEIYEIDIDGTTCAMLKTFYKAEDYIARRLEVMRSIAHDNKIDYSAIIDLEEQETGIEYAEKQRKAINLALSEGFLVLTGGPGTGKTTTLNAMISLFEQQGMDVLIAAPTGRAAKRTSDLTGHEAKTIHRLLEVMPADGERTVFIHDEDDLLECDVLVVDEMSMVDSELFEALLHALSVTCKLILVGDSDQLPPVGPGSVLQDIIASGVMSVVRLTEVFRQAQQSDIVMNAHKIVSGEMIDVKKRDNDFVYMCRPEAEGIYQTLVELCAERLPKRYGFQPVKDIQVLSPTKQGCIGTPQLNKLLQEKLNPPAKDKPELKTAYRTYRMGDKVMQTKNNYTISWKESSEDEEESGKGVFNGDIGIVTDVDTRTKTVSIDFEGRIAEYRGDMLDDLELAYAVTVHKSQGSEYEAVILTLFEGMDNLYYRNLLYTAVTRAKRLLVILGTAQRIGYMIMNNGKNRRCTALRTMLMRNAYGDELNEIENNSENDYSNLSE